MLGSMLHAIACGMHKYITWSHHHVTLPCGMPFRPCLLCMNILIIRLLNPLGWAAYCNVANANSKCKHKDQMY